MRSQTDIAREIATAAHRGQYRRDGNTPYIAHPNAVADRLADRGADDETVATAWLHDVLEDTDTTLIQLKDAGISPRVLRAVHTLSKNFFPDLTYEKWIELVVRGDAIAVEVKVADMLHNLSDSPTEKQILKYAKGLQLLLG